MASDGIAQDIAVFKRKTGFSYEKFRYHEFYGYLTFTDLWAQYRRLRVKFLFSVGLGSITARVGANKVFVKLTLDDDSSKLFGYRLVEYYIKVHVKHVKVRVYNNLPVVDWIFSQIVNYVSNLYVKQISLMIEKNLKDAIKKVFRKKL
ncbi:uncharacterized protein LOC119657869 [Hermetia illucens]|nr:uncharacterized protein LOC119657869 [Hermetia illucens]